MRLDELAPELLNAIAHFMGLGDMCAMFRALGIEGVPEARVRGECRRLGINTDAYSLPLGTRRVCDIVIAFSNDSKCLSLPSLGYLSALFEIRVLGRTQDGGCDFARLHDMVCEASEVPQLNLLHPFWVTFRRRAAGRAGMLACALTENWTLHEDAAKNIASSLRHGHWPLSLFRTCEDQLTAGLCNVGADVCAQPDLNDLLSWRGFSQYDSNRGFCTVLALVVGAVVFGRACMDSVQSAVRLACEAVGPDGQRSLSFDTRQLVATISTIFRLAQFEREASASQSEEGARRRQHFGGGRDCRAVAKGPQYCATVEMACEYMSPKGSSEIVAVAADAYMMLAPLDVPTANIVRFVNGFGDALNTLEKLVAAGLFKARPIVRPADVIAVYAGHGIGAFDSNCMQLLGDDSLSTQDVFAMVLRKGNRTCPYVRRTIAEMDVSYRYIHATETLLQAGKVVKRPMFPLSVAKRLFENYLPVGTVCSDAQAHAIARALVHLKPCTVVQKRVLFQLKFSWCSR